MSFIRKKSVKKNVKQIKVLESEFKDDDMSSVYLSQEYGGSTRAGKSSKNAAVSSQTGIHGKKSNTVI